MKKIKKSKRIVPLFIGIIMAFMMNLTAFADKPVGNYSYECFTYNINSNGSVTLISCDSSVTDIEIPDQINNMDVSAINGSTFQGCNLLKSITISDDNKYFTVDENGILTNKLKTRIIKCPSLSNISSYTIADTFTSVAPYCFENCSRLEYVKIPESVETIGAGAFDGTAFSNVTISNENAFIGENAFGYSNGSKNTDFTIYGKTGSSAQQYADANGIGFSALDNSAFNVSINGNLYFYNDDSSFSGEKIVITNKDGTNAVHSFSKTPAGIFEENGPVSSDVEILSALGNHIANIKVRVAMAGDSNQDGKLNVRDAAFIAASLSKGEKFIGFDKMCADKNKDNIANIRDAADIARSLA